MKIFEELVTFEVIINFIVLLLLYLYFMVLRYLFFASLLKLKGFNIYNTKFKNKFGLFILSSIVTSAITLFHLYLALISFGLFGIFYNAINWIAALHIYTILYCIWKCWHFYLIDEFPIIKFSDKINIENIKKLNSFHKKNKQNIS